MSEQVESHLRAAVQLLESLHAAGVQQMPRRSKAPLATVARPIQSSSPEVAITATHFEQARSSEMAAGSLFNPTEVSLIESSSAATLEILRDEVSACAKCHELATSRTQTVFGVGNPRSRLCFLGEAPGADEDRLGEPFVGRAGQLLNKILEACRLKREEVYILNVIKCRPPGNRNPAPEEALNCRPYLNRQLELIQPEYICCLGAVAAQNLLGTQASIGKLRGKVHNYHDVKVVCTYHPAYLLRNPVAKKDAWEDMKFLMRTMGSPVD